MGLQNIFKLFDGVYWVGVKDWNRRLFDAFIPLPQGTSYNSYLILGNEKKALIDTVNPGFEKDLEEKIKRIMDPVDIDFIIMNHAEPDHAGAIPYLMEKNKKAILVTTKKGVEMAKVFYKVPQERMKAVSDGDSIELGGKTLLFIEAPMLHWPETMFTYIKEDKILFPCDFFGMHIARGNYDDEVEDLLIHAQKYFGEIMMPFRTMAIKALEKISNLEIQMIAPSHGPIHKNVNKILEAYKKWAYGKTKIKATIIYTSMWNSTEKMVNTITKTLANEGIEVVMYNLAVTDIGDLIKDLVDSRAVVIGAPTVLGGIHPLAQHAAYILKALRPPIKLGAILSSYGWGGVAAKQIKDLLETLKIEVVGFVEVRGPPSEKDLMNIIEIGKSLANKIKEIN